MSPKTAIALFCYKRADKLKVVVEALLKNPECDSMDIVFFADGYKGDKDRADVEATRAYVDSIRGFNKIEKQYRERNISTGPNFFQGITYMCDNYDRFIVVEDDLVVTPNYIRYMLDALDFYRDEPSVFCVTGYCFPLRKNGYPYDTVMYNRFCSYGWASWSDRVKQVKWDKETLIRIVHTSPGFKRHLNKTGMDLFRMVKKQINGTISTWDIQMQVHVALNNFKVVYPVLSKTSNIGFGAGSTNTFGVDYLKTITDPGDKRAFRFCSPFVVAPGLQKQLKRPYGLPALATRKVLNTMIQMAGKVKSFMSF